jgi:malate synthase
MSTVSALGTKGVRVMAEDTPASTRVLTTGALEFVAALHRRFNPVREELLRAREARQAEIDAGVEPTFLAETAAVRERDWRVGPTPADLQDRRVEITGPTDAKMVINALNSGASCFMADFEDALSPTWKNVVEGQANMQDAVRRTLAFSGGGKEYRLGEKPAVLIVRPRGWHLPERHVQVDGEPVSASLFDFGMYFFHNAEELLERGSGPVLLPPEAGGAPRGEALERRLHLRAGAARHPARLDPRHGAHRDDPRRVRDGRDPVRAARPRRGAQRGAVGLHLQRHQEVREARRLRAAGPGAGHHGRSLHECYAELLVKTCHRRGAHAMGGMAAFIPSRRDAEVNRVAMAKVTEDKAREAGQGFDGTWVAHPDLVPIARAEFDRVLGERPNQKEKQGDANVRPRDLLNTGIADGRVTEAGVRLNVSVALQYLEAWLRGNGAVAINNLMEDAATAEISRAQLWQWIRNRTPLDDEGAMTPDVYTRIRNEEMERLRASGVSTPELAKACKLLDELVLGNEFVAFLTLPAYPHLA